MKQVACNQPLKADSRGIIYKGWCILQISGSLMTTAYLLHPERPHALTCISGLLQGYPLAVSP